MNAIVRLIPLVILAGCAAPAAHEDLKGGGKSEAHTSAVAACKSALALRSGQNTVFVLPVSSAQSAGGYEVFLSLQGASWLCTTDSHGNVNRLEKR